MCSQTMSSLFLQTCYTCIMQWHIIIIMYVCTTGETGAWREGLELLYDIGGQARACKTCIFPLSANDDVFIMIVI